MAASVNIHTLQIGQNMPESARLYRQAENDPSDLIFPFIYKALCQKNIPSEALLLLTVYVISIRDKPRHTVSHTVIPEANPAIDVERSRDIYLSKSSVYGAS